MNSSLYTAIELIAYRQAGANDAIINVIHHDKKNIGTYKYAGVAFFWNVKYNCYMRTSSTKFRKHIHHLFMKHNLVLAGTSPKHLKIILDEIKKEK